MTHYFHEQESVASRFGDDDAAILKVLAERYVGANPQAGFTYRAFYASGILQNEEGLYELDLARRFPAALPGQTAYACALVWSDGERNLDLLIRCLGPVRFFFNRELAYRSNVIDEMKPGASAKLNLNFVKGWNALFLSFRCTAVGFGCLIGADEAKVRILNVLSPFSERQGQAGWAFSEPVKEDLIPQGWGVPELLGAEHPRDIRWLPRVQWDEDAGRLPTLERLFGRRPGSQAYAWTKLDCSRMTGEWVTLEGSSSGPAEVWVDGDLVLAVEASHGAPFAGRFRLTAGKHDLLFRSVCGEASWDCSLQVTGEGTSRPELAAPIPVLGAETPWLYAGPFGAELELPYDEWVRTDRLYPLDSPAVMSVGAADAVQPSADSWTYWQLDLPDAWIRPYYENSMLSNKWTVGNVTNYARWDYPLGVTVYGLLQTGRWLQRPDLIRYAAEHVQACTDLYEYSLWDRERYGFPAINQQLVMMKMLDNCGSFGSAMLEAFRDCGDLRFLPVADRIADFMLNRLERKEDGAFYRVCADEYSENTMWADDLYMSAPFLCRFAQVTGRPEALDEAARQFLLFRSYLFLPDERIMSHVYDFKYGAATGIPWGRGNGWTLFSLSEVLEALPEDHALRPELLGFFRELCEGYAALQADSGLWHQVLNDPEAYEEASCTAMFAYAFARGVRFKWLHDPQRFTAAAFKAWAGLTRYAIDRQGNVHGVCSGSRYAFTPDYYKYDLLTVTNDNHGIGIMMLAGTEIAKLKWYLAEAKQSAV
ncbi:glycoside hydrolase family 105 protein [Paenibacillus sp. OAS669]|uniref:glycoside hydrolase family 88/105 protein n=1 Tax=Paenibacillus sp. OAS669 TaxID=2663821 RepID=UPI00178A1209|nr:glycoside hydrolase family 88 protein [Paenibacillus sp. OAS669]MBE1441008.1 rhamnogalacturonyl hydrolase YesR [Paenibacillus sp. OAS669]